MSARRLGLLAIAALLVAAGALWLSSSRSDRDTLAGDAVLPEARARVNEVTEVRLSKGDRSRVTLRRAEGAWQVAERGYPADSGKVRKLLLDLTGLEVIEEKTSDPANYPLLGVEDVKGTHAAGVLAEIVSPQVTRSIVVGKPSGTKASFVRVAGRPTTLLASPQLSLETDPRRWLAAELLDIDAARVHRVEINPASGPPYSAARDQPGAAELEIAALPRGRELSSPGAATALAAGLDGLTIDDVKAADAGRTPQPLRAKFSTFDGLVVELAGHKDGTRGFVTVEARYDAALASGFAGMAKEAKLPAATEVEKEAAAVTARSRGWQFELPAWKFDAIFRPLEELLKPR